MSGVARPAAAHGPADARRCGGDEARLAAIAHDLRTPLNAIRAWAAVLQGELAQAPSEVQRALRGIQEGVDAEALLIERLLEPGRDPLEGSAADDPAPPRGER